MACPHCQGCVALLRILEASIDLHGGAKESQKKKHKPYEESMILRNGFNVFDENTFPGLKGGDCVSCMEHTKSVMVCCEQPVCKKCFVEWCGNENKGACMHCREKIKMKK